jgi:hypothetical protein
MTQFQTLQRKISSLKTAKSPIHQELMIADAAEKVGGKSTTSLQPCGPAPEEHLEAFWSAVNINVVGIGSAMIGGPQEVIVAHR